MMKQKASRSHGKLAMLCLPACLRRIKSGGKLRRGEAAVPAGRGLQFQTTTQSKPHMHA